MESLDPSAEVRILALNPLRAAFMNPMRRGGNSF
jgi:hypothetical protein